MAEEFVILVDEQDNELGAMEKIEAHEKALLRRAARMAQALRWRMGS